MRLAAILAVVMTPPGASARQQQSVPQTPAAAPAVTQAEITDCAQAHTMAERTIDLTNRRLEAARQTNSAAAMRSAIDDMQAALRQLRAEIAPCAGLQSVEATDPHAGHVMPRTATTAAASATPARQPNSADGPTITFRSMPSPPRGAAANEFEVTVKDRQGRPVDGGDVTLLFYMPARPSIQMPEMRNEVKLKDAGNGRYTGTAQVMMAGSWMVTVTVKQKGEEIGQQKVTFAAK